MPLPGETKLDKAIFLSGAGGVVEFHTSCSKPFGPGYSLGDFTILDGASVKGGANMCPVARIDNQFGTEYLNIKTAKRLLAPSFKDLLGPVPGANWPTDIDHYKCYDVAASDQFKGLQVSLEDQFNTRDFEIDKAKQLCNAVAVTNGGITPILNETEQLACYKIKPLQPRFCALIDPSSDPTDLSVG